ncbi:MAG: hypothetical protein COB53_10130 [Elusimicrobia bacterium]|nr:MAG: hypothetical protein COB53_10130 [Elusimicrobiota bacterium]
MKDFTDEEAEKLAGPNPWKLILQDWRVRLALVSIALAAGYGAWKMRPEAPLPTLKVVAQTHESSGPVSTIVGKSVAHQGSMNSVEFSPDGLHLASADYTDAAKVWDIKTLDHLHTVKGASMVTFSRDGKFLVIARNPKDKFQSGKILVYETLSWEQIKTIRSPEGQIDSIAFSPDGKRFVSCANTKKKGVHELINGSCRVVNFADRTILADWKEGRHQIGDVHFSADGERVAYTLKLLSGDYLSYGDHVFVIRQADNGKQLHRFGDSEGELKMITATLAPGGKQAAFSFWETEVMHIKDVAGKTVQVLSEELLNVEKPRHPFARGRFSADGNFFAAPYSKGKGRGIRVWDARTWKPLYYCPVEGGAVLRLAVSDDGKFIAAATGSMSASKLYVFDLAGGSS